MTNKPLIIDDFAEDQADVDSAMVKKIFRKWSSLLATSGSRSRIVVAQTPCREDDPHNDLLNKRCNQHTGDTP